MLLKFFKRPLPIVFISILLLAMIIWLKALVTKSWTPFPFDIIQMPLFDVFQEYLTRSIIIDKISGFVIMLLSALYLIQINSKYIIVKQRTYLLALLYILFSSSFLPLQRLNPSALAALFLIISMDYLFSIYESKSVNNSVFMGAFFIGIASLIYLPAAFYILIAFVAIIILKANHLRDWIISVIGFLTPWFFVGVYYYLINDDLYFIADIVEKNWTSLSGNKVYGLSFILFYAFGGIIFFISTLYLLGSLPTLKIKNRQFFSLFLWFLFVTAIITFLLPFSSIEIVYIASFPVAFLVTNFFVSTRNKFWPETLFSILFALAVVLQFIGP